jgi:hypothetical protein
VKNEEEAAKNPVINLSFFYLFINKGLAILLAFLFELIKTTSELEARTTLFFLQRAS